MSGRPGRFARGWLQAILLALIFFVPILLATWLYFEGGSLLPEGQTNHGAILEPIVNLEDALPGSDIGALAEGHWLLIYMHDGPCGAACRESLHAMRQMRLMLGKDMSRVRRVFLHGSTPADTVFPEERHPDLAVLEDEALGRLLRSRYAGPAPEGGFFLVDPRANLVMYFAPGLVPGDIVDDMEHLLDLSQIG